MFFNMSFCDKIHLLQINNVEYYLKQPYIQGIEIWNFSGINPDIFIDKKDETTIASLTKQEYIELPTDFVFIRSAPLNRGHDIR